jgi:uncharacterized protein (TIGR03435 family)
VRRFLGVGRIMMAAVVVALAPATPATAQTQPTFEVASVKVHDPPTPPFAQIRFGRDSLTLTEIDLSIALTLAYGVRNYQIQGPDWLHFGLGGGKFFDVLAKASGPVSRDQLRLMLGTLLAERFHLTFHRERKEMPAIALLVAKGGPKLQASAPGTEMDSQWIGFDNMLQVPGPKGHTFSNASVPALAMAVAASLGGGADPVVDMTGLSGRYDFLLRDTPRPLPDDPPQTPDDRFAITRAIVQDDLGLTLEHRKAPIEILIVDHVDKAPTEN